MRKAITLLGAILALSAASLSAAPAKWGSSMLKQKPEWYATQEARDIADNLLLYQSEYGAWPKNTDLLATATDDALRKIEEDGNANTIDNGATIPPMRFIALVYQGSHVEKYKDAFIRGVRYLLEAQYPNGGFPQFYPLRGDKYYSRITYNDGAMVAALELLRDIAQGDARYAFVDDDLRSKVEASVNLGIDCILKSQIRQDGKLTAWCAQIDEHTLKPAWARKYEPPSLSGGETVGIVRFLMSIERPSPEVVAAVDGAVEWLREVAIHGKRLEIVRRDDGRKERVLIDDPNAPLLWARFYELETNRPLYMDRDSQPVYDFNEIDYERRSGYSYHGTWAADLLAKNYPKWKAKRS